MINIVKDVDLYNHLNEYDLILIGTNIYHQMPHGIQLKVMLNYPYVYNKNLETKYGDMEKLGTILECSSEGEPTFCLCWARQIRSSCLRLLSLARERVSLPAISLSVWLYSAKTIRGSSFYIKQTHGSFAICNTSHFAIDRITIFCHLRLPLSNFCRSRRRTYN